MHNMLALPTDRSSWALPPCHTWVLAVLHRHLRRVKALHGLGETPEVAHVKEGYKRQHLDRRTRSKAFSPEALVQQTQDREQRIVELVERGSVAMLDCVGAEVLDRAPP
jgi:hypothetical protein